jgi:hypothetical protein
MIVIPAAKEKHTVPETKWKDKFLGDSRFYRFQWPKNQTISKRRRNIKRKSIFQLPHHDNC